VKLVFTAKKIEETLYVIMYGQYLLLYVHKIGLLNYTKKLTVVDPAEGVGGAVLGLILSVFTCL
jgi:hypothetical protein